MNFALFHGVRSANTMLGFLIMYRNTTIFILSCFVLAGCATSPVGLQESQSTPARQLISSPSAQVPDIGKGGHLIVVRDSGFSGSGANLRLSIDGFPVADLKVSQHYDVFLKEGEYILAAIPVPNLFSAYTNTEVPVTIKKGQTYTFRVGFGNGGLVLQRSTLSGR